MPSVCIGYKPASEVSLNVFKCKLRMFKDVKKNNNVLHQSSRQFIFLHNFHIIISKKCSLVL